MKPDFAGLANPSIGSLRAYDPGHDLPRLRVRFGALLAELGSNENPDGPSPAAVAAMRHALEQAHRYPDPRCGALREALAAELGLTGDGLVFGNGSHELLMQLAQCFAGPDRAVMFSQYGFAVFAIAAAAAGAPARCVEALPGTDPESPLGHDLQAMRRAFDDSVRLIYLANPNNPTGSGFSHEALADFLDALPAEVLVVVDEAYAEYAVHEGHRSAVGLLARHANLAVTRTFSKAHALAGLRIGYLAADPGLCAVLERLRESFNVNGVAQAAALASLGDAAHRARVLQNNRIERLRVAEALAACGYPVLPSRTNFLLIDCHGDAGALEGRLHAAGVIVRPMGGYGLPGHLRVSIGSRRENDRLLELLA